MVGTSLQLDEGQSLASFQHLNICLNRFEILPRHGVRWIQTQGDLKLLERLIQFAQLCEGKPIVRMAWRKVRATMDNFGKLGLSFLKFSFRCQFAPE